MTIPLRATCSVGDRVTYSPTCHGEVVRITKRGKIIIRLDSGSTVTAGEDTIRPVRRRLGWLLGRRGRA